MEGHIGILENSLSGDQKSRSEQSAKLKDANNTVQLALEFKMFNLSKSEQSVSSSSSNSIHDCFPHKYSQLHPSIRPELSAARMFPKSQVHIVSSSVHHNKSENPNSEFSIFSRTNSLTEVNNIRHTYSLSYEDRSKKSQNMTECVPVPSSEHVAEIVGRQGCKIKALRAKTNTYIKTPVRNEEPVFVVTGRKEDVNKAKQEILSAAEHFTAIRATRRLNDNMVAGSPSSPGNSAIFNDSIIMPLHTNSSQITIQVRVPYRLVGLVVGTKGNTIKHIQHETHTYIVTPSRDKDPVFEVTGLADNVELAKKHIEIHIAARIKGSQNNSIETSMSSPSPTPCTTSKSTIVADSTDPLQTINAFNQILDGDLHTDILSSIYKSGICSTLDSNSVTRSKNVKERYTSVHTINGFLGDLNISLYNDNRGEILASDTDTYSFTDETNNQIKCVDFINNLMDSNLAQFNIDRSQFT